MEYKVRQLLKNKMVPALLCIALGILIVIARRAAVDFLVKCIGGLVIAAAVGFVAVYMTRPDKDAGNLPMVLAIAGVTALTGILLITFAENIVDIFPVIMGLYLIMNGLSHLTAAYVSTANRVTAAVLGVLVIVLGVLIVFRPGFLVNMIMVFIGGSFIVNGLSDLLLLRQVRNELQ